MNGISCLHPKIIKNKYNGITQAVRCGKCEACQNSRSAQWVERLNQEMQFHKYTYFVTFQYDEQHVPQFVRVRPEHCIKDNEVLFLDVETGQLIDFFDKSVSRHEKRDFNFVNETKVLLVPSVRDFQLFMKRLRKKISKYGNIRYFCTFELGNQTFRPHSHTLFFFDSPLLAKDFPQMLVDTWKYGRVFDPHPIKTGSAAEYVASYVNCFADLPAIYLHKDIRPKSVFSKCPPIGTLQYGFEEIQRLFFNGVTKLTLYDRLRNEFRDVPLWRHLQLRLYPRLQGFGSLTHFDRVALYRAAQIVTSRECAKEQIRAYLKRCYSLYYYCITHVDNKFNEDSFSNFVRVVMRVAHNAALFGITIEDYVSRIENYYEEKQKSDLKDWFRFQENYFQAHSPAEIINFDPYFCWKITHNRLNEYEKKFIEFNGLPKNVGFMNTSDYQKLLKLHTTIYYNNCKTKKANDYLLKHQEKFTNIIHFKYE